MIAGAASLSFSSLPAARATSFHTSSYSLSSLSLSSSAFEAAGSFIFPRASAAFALSEVGSDLSRRIEISFATALSLPISPNAETTAS